MSLNDAINKAIELTITEGVKNDKDMIKEKDIKVAEKLYRLYGAWFAINLKTNLSKILKENEEKVEEN